jgi:hypothetical protein
VVWRDALVVTLREGGRVGNTPRDREILGLDLGAAEDGAA